MNNIKAMYHDAGAIAEAKELELYIHIPFCVKKCAYCDFVSFEAGEMLKARYIEALLNEIKKYAPTALNYTVCSIFIGGGTPSILDSKYISLIMKRVRAHYNVSKNAEITIEANSGTVDAQKLDAYLDLGINRISIGCQSVNNENLKLLGRIHRLDDFLNAYEDAIVVGFKNINVDMMFALPDQSVGEWEDELKFVSSLNISHISAYSLILEENTPFYGMKDELKFPSDDEAAAMYEAAGNILSKKGFTRYEISNYAKKGFECIHNVGYWRRVPYLGFGLAAASFSGTIRRKNTGNIERYISGIDTAENIEQLSKREQMSEFMILGLRMTDGVSADDFKKEFGIEIADAFAESLKKHLKNDTVCEKNGRIFIPEKYLFVSNSIMADFV